jgi:hypothetical protein
MRIKKLRRDRGRSFTYYTTDSRWRNRAEFLQGRTAVEAFLTRKWQRETVVKVRRRFTRKSPQPRSPFAGKPDFAARDRPAKGGRPGPTPVALLAGQPVVLLARKDFPAYNLQGFHQPRQGAS